MLRAARRPPIRQAATVSESLLTEEQLADAPDHMICPISLDLMLNPVKLVPTGQVFDHPSLMTWFQSGGRNCPMTGVQLSGTVKLQADVVLREEITAWLQAQGKDPDAIRRATSLAWRNADMCGKKGQLQQSRQRRRPDQGAILNAMIKFLTSRTYARVYAEIY